MSRITFRKLSNAAGPLAARNTRDVCPCFTPGTRIATQKGERPVETLRVGDKVITRDNGIQEIRWIGARLYDWRARGVKQDLKPVVLRKGALGHGLPERDLLVSPNHRILVASDKTQLFFDEPEVFVAAKHIINNSGIAVADIIGTTYIHFMFDQHQVVLSDGCWTESFQPSDATLKGMGNSQRSEIFEIFPVLKHGRGPNAYKSARRTLDREEAGLLTK